MNAAGIEAIRSALADAEENLYRWRWWADQDSCTGYGQPVRDVVALLEREQEQLRIALHEARAS